MTSHVCARCDKPTNEPVIVGHVHSASIGGRTIYSCPEHALTFPQHIDPIVQIDALRRARHEGEAVMALRAAQAGRAW
ncbi:hypothetical protein ACH4S9_36970 [Streptomyces sp. NPDC021225]|uniref:hypothetical protein n=1 Tax=Streptomyces sp. NPDC021225 TaxID=3365121 RepID=UPI0037A596F6